VRLVLVGAVEGSRQALEALLEAGGNIVHVFTLAPEYARRHSDFADLRPLCERFGVPLSGVNNINDPEVLEQIRGLAPDYLLVLGWSQIVKPELLQLPRHGAIGFHPALLPEGRGRAALPWVILLGLEQSGCTLFFMDEGMDSGDIICQQVFNIAPDETAQTLYDKVTSALRAMIAEIAPGLKRGELPRRPQDQTRATYTAKRTQRDGLIDWQQPAHKIWTLIRAVGAPYPGAFTFYRQRRLIVWEADFVPHANYVGVVGQVLRLEPGGVLVQGGEGCLRLVTVQEDGQAMMPATEYFTRVHDVLGLDWLALYEQSLRSIRGDKS